MSEEIRQIARIVLEREQVVDDLMHQSRHQRHWYLTHKIAEGGENAQFYRVILAAVQNREEGRVIYAIPKRPDFSARDVSALDNALAIELAQSHITDSEIVMSNAAQYPPVPKDRSDLIQAIDGAFARFYYLRQLEKDDEA